MTDETPMPRAHEMRDCLRFLVLTATFPPRGGSSVQRVAKFVKYARRAGHEPIVVTTSYAGRYRDEGLLTELPADLDIRRVAPELPSGGELGAKIGRLLSRFSYPDEYSAWRRAAVREGRSILKTQNVDAIFVSFGSPSAMLAGARLAREFAAPLVLDVRDMWTRAHIRNRRNRPGTLLGLVDTYVERVAWKRVERFTVVSEGYADIMNLHYGVAGDRCTVIYNGYDPEDFPAIQDAADRAEPSIRFAGFITEEGSFSNLVRAVALLNERRSARGRSAVRLEIMGQIPAVLRQSLGAEPAWLHFHPYAPHEDAVRFMCEADILALFQPAMPGMLTGKFFEYAAARRPILHLDNGSPELAGLIARHRLGLSIRHDDIEDIAATVERLLVPENALPAPPREFRRDIQAEQFLDVIRAARSSRSGRCARP